MLEWTILYILAGREEEWENKGVYNSPGFIKTEIEFHCFTGNTQVDGIAFFDSSENNDRKQTFHMEPNVCLSSV